MWVVCPIAQLCKRHKDPCGLRAPAKSCVEVHSPYLPVGGVLPSHYFTLDQCKGKKLPKDLCQINSFANNRKDEDLSQLQLSQSSSHPAPHCVPAHPLIQAGNFCVLGQTTKWLAKWFWLKSFIPSPWLWRHMGYMLLLKSDHSSLSQGQPAFGWWECTLLRQLRSYEARREWTQGIRK